MNTVLPFAVSFLVQVLVLKYFYRHSMCIDGAGNFKPQRIHENPTPRAGGLGIFAGSIVAIFMAEPLGALFVVSALPVFLVGFAEDMSSRVNPLQRLFIIALGACLGALFLDAVIIDIGFFTLPLALAIPFTVFAVTGIANAVNIVDGMNGLASGVSMLTFIFLALAAYMAGDMAVAALSLVMLAATTGFFVFNFPKGKIFLGDGGAYFIGFAIAELSVMLVNRNPGVSPWFPLALMAYPVTEVVFTIFRRKVKKGRSAFMPDMAHLHSLLYKRVTRNNSCTACLFWALAATFDTAAFFLLESSVAMIAVFASFAVVYLLLYSRVVRFRAPAFLMSLSGNARSIKPRVRAWTEPETPSIEVYNQKIGERR